MKTVVKELRLLSLCKVDSINLLAIILLEKLGIHHPLQDQINAAEDFIKKVIYEGKFTIDKKLTRRERQCLFWAAKGKTTQQTAKILRLDPTTIETHRISLRKKLDCQNMAQAVYQGMKYAALCPDMACECNNRELIS